MDDLHLLRERVRLLDQEAARINLVQSDRLAADLDAFIRVMSTVTPRDSGERLSALTADAADDAIKTSQLIYRVRRASAAIVDGPVDLESQQWVATHPPPHRPPRLSTPSEQAFIDIEAVEGAPKSTKPFEVGFHTSTAAASQPGMWLRYLELNRGTTLFGMPWTVWDIRIKPSARVFEVRSAREWAALLSSYPLQHEGATYPNWKGIAKDLDGVHFTLPAIAAIQGLRIELDGFKAAAPSYWDVESTLWLRWMVESSEPVGLVCASA